MLLSISMSLPPLLPVVTQLMFVKFPLTTFLQKMSYNYVRPQCGENRNRKLFIIMAPLEVDSHCYRVSNEAERCVSSAAILSNKPQTQFFDSDKCLSTFFCEGVLKSNSSFFPKKQTQGSPWINLVSQSVILSTLLCEVSYSATRHFWIAVTKIAQCKATVSVRNKRYAVIEFLTAEKM